MTNETRLQTRPAKTSSFVPLQEVSTGGCLFVTTTSQTVDNTVPPTLLPSVETDGQNEKKNNGRVNIKASERLREREGEKESKGQRKREGMHSESSREDKPGLKTHNKHWPAH